MNLSVEQAGDVLLALNRLAVRLRADTYDGTSHADMAAKVAAGRKLIARLLAGQLPAPAFRIALEQLAVWHGVLYVRDSVWRGDGDAAAGASDVDGDSDGDAAVPEQPTSAISVRSGTPDRARIFMKAIGRSPIVRLRQKTA